MVFLFGFLMCCEWIKFWPGSCVCFEILFWTLFIPLDLRNIHNQALYWLVSSLVFSSVSEGFVFYFWFLFDYVSSLSCPIHPSLISVLSSASRMEVSLFSVFHYPFCLPSRVTVSGLSMLVCFHCHRKFICLQSCFLCFNMCHRVVLAPVPVSTRLNVGLNVGVLGPV